MVIPKYSDLLREDRFQASPYDKRVSVTNNYWDAYEKETGDVEYAKGQRELALRRIDLKDESERADPINRRVLSAEADDVSFALGATEALRRGELDQTGYQKALGAHEERRAQNKARIDEIKPFFEQSKRKAEVRMAMAEEFQKSGVFNSVTAAAGGAADKQIRLLPNGDWDIPELYKTTGNPLLDSVSGALNNLSQKAGARMQNTGAADSQIEMQNIFKKIQESTGSSEEEMKAAWMDIGNSYRKMEDGEKARVLSDGTIVPNYANSDWLNPEKAAKIIDSLPAPDLAKELIKHDLKGMNGISQNIAHSKLEAYTTAAILNPLESPVDWAKKKGRIEDYGTPKFVEDYEKEVASQAGTGSQLLADYAQGGMQLISTGAGAAALASSYASDGLEFAGFDDGARRAGDFTTGLGKAGAEVSKTNQLSNQGMGDTRLTDWKATEALPSFGKVLEEFPSLVAQALTTKGIGAGATAAGFSKVAAGRIGMAGMLTTAGMQSAGMTYSQEIANGSSEDVARTKATKAGLNTALVTVMFQKLGMGGAESMMLGRGASGYTIRDLFAKQSKVEFAKAMGRVGGGLSKDILGEGLEEGWDEFTAAFLNADPDTNLSDAWPNAVEAAKIGAGLGGGMGTISSLGETPTHLKGLNELERQANATSKSTAQENFPKTEAEGRAFPTSGPVSLAEIERERAAQIELTEDPEERASLETSTPQELAEGWGVDLTEESQEPGAAVTGGVPGGTEPAVAPAPEPTPNLEENGSNLEVVPEPSTAEAAVPTEPLPEGQATPEGKGVVASVIPDEGNAPKAKEVVQKFLTPEAKALPPESFKQQKVASPEQVALQNKVAKMYDDLPEDDSKNPEVVKAYENLTTEVLEQHKAMTDSGLKIELVSENPYASSKEMIEDVKRGKLKVQRTDPQTFGSSPEVFTAGNHPMLKDSGLKDVNGQLMLVNDVFRGVHDYIAHAAFGSTFGALGEEAAWKAHLATIKDPLARRALTTETRGQNSWVNYRDEMLRDGKPIKKGEAGYVAPQDRPFATQKFALLPEEALQETNVQNQPQTTAPSQVQVPALPTGETQGTGAVAAQGNQEGAGAAEAEAEVEVDPLEALVAELESLAATPDAITDEGASSDSETTLTLEIKAIIGDVSLPVVEAVDKERVHGIVDTVLTPAEQNEAAAVLGEKLWNDTARKKFSERFAEWLVKGKDVSNKLSRYFKKIWKVLRAAGLGGVLFFTPSIDTLSDIQVYNVPVSEFSTDSATINEVRTETSARVPDLGDVEAEDDPSIGDTPRIPDFGSTSHSTNSRIFASWVLRTGDNNGKPFVVADKNEGSLYFFDGNGKLISKSAALFGRDHGDVFRPDQLNRSISETRNAKDGRITPAGRFETKTDNSKKYGKVLPLMSKGAGSRIAIHRTVAGREKFYGTDKSRVSLGCINVPAPFIEKLADGFTTGGVIYVLPESNNKTKILDGFPTSSTDRNPEALVKAGIDPVAAYLLALAGIALSRKRAGRSRKDTLEEMESEIANSRFSDAKKQQLRDRLFPVIEQSFGTKPQTKPTPKSTQQPKAEEVKTDKKEDKVTPEKLKAAAPQLSDTATKALALLANRSLIGVDAELVLKPREEGGGTEGEVKLNQSAESNRDTAPEEAPRASITFARNASKAIVEIHEAGDESSFLHELAHFLENFVLNPNDPEAVAEAARRGITPEMTNNLIRMMGGKLKDGKYVWSWQTTDTNGKVTTNVRAREKFARAVESYFKNKEFPDHLSEADKVIFADILKLISEWFDKIYKAFADSDVNLKIQPEVKALLDKLLFPPTLEEAPKGSTPQTKAKAPTTKPKIPARKVPVMVFGVKKADLEKAKKRHGIPEASGYTVKMTDQAAFDEAYARLARYDAGDKSAKVGMELVLDISLRDTLGADKVEVALLAIHGFEIERAMADFDEKINALDSSKTEAKKFYEKEIAELSQDFTHLVNVTRRVGSKAGLALQAMKLVASRVYSVDAMLRRAAVWRNASNKGEDKSLSPTDVRKIEDLAKKIKESTETREDLQDEDEKKYTLAEYEAMFAKKAKDVAKEKKTAKPRSSITATVASSALERLRKLGVGAEVKLNQSAESNRDTAYLAAVEAGDMETGHPKAGQPIPLSERFDPEEDSLLFQSAPEEDSIRVQILEDLANVGTSYLENGAKTLEKFTEKLVADFGEEFRSEAEIIYGMAQDKYKKLLAKVSQKTPQELASLIDPTLDISERMVYNMVHGFLRQGLEGKAVLVAVTKILQENGYPKLTRDEVMVAFTRYGKIKNLSEDEIKVASRKLKGVERLGAQLLDIAKGFFPKKTGLRRDPTTSPVRSLMKQIKQAMIDAGMNYTDEQDKKTRLAGARDHMKRAIENQLDDMANAIKTGERIDRTKRDPVTDPILDKLKKERDAMLLEYRAIFGIDAKKISVEAQIKRASKMLDREIKILEAEARGEILNKPTKIKLDSPELRAKRERLEALREAKRAAKEALNPAKTSAQIATDRLRSGAEKSIERFEYFTKNGEFPPKADGTTYTREDFPAELLALRDRLRDTVREIQKDRRILTPPEVLARNRAVRQLSKTIADLEARIAKRDFSKRAKKPESTDPEVVNLKATVKSLRDTLDQMEKDTLKPIDPKEKRMQRMLAASRRRSRKLVQKLRDKDFVRPVKRDQKDHARVVAAKVREAKLKDEFDKLRQKWLRENLKGFDKFMQIIKDTLFVRKIILLGGEFGVVFRQGFSFTMRAWRHPKQVLGVLGEAFFSTFSQNKEIAIYQASMDHPLAVWDKAGPGMHFHNPFGVTTRNSNDDIFDTEIIDKIAKIKYIGAPAKVIGGIERFTRAFQNASRRSLQQSYVDTLLFLGGEVNKDTMAVINNAVMNATGRGSLKSQTFDSALTAANAIVISSRYYISRAKVATFEPLWTTHGGYEGTVKARAAVAHELYVKTLVGKVLLSSLMYWLAKGLDDDDEEKLEWNLTSSNFLKFDYKGTKIDITGGLRPFVNVIARLFVGYRKNSKGEYVSLSGAASDYFTGDTTDEILKFAENRLNVNLRFALNVIAGKNYDGNVMTPLVMAEEFALPIMKQDTVDIFRAHGPVEGLAVWSAMFLGATVNAPALKKPPVEGEEAVLDIVRKPILKMFDIEPEEKKKKASPSSFRF